MEPIQQSVTEATPSSPSPPPVAIDTDKRFPVMEIFGPTVQGEGLVAGQQTLFIRFGGCDYRCKMCDSLHAVLPELVKEGARYLTAEEIVAEITPIVERTGVRWITFSGGNPCMHKLGSLVDMLSQNVGLGIAVETQGTIWANWLMACDVVTVSPKGPGMGEKFEPDKFEFFVQRLYGHPGFNVKVVIMDQRDIEFAVHLLGEYPQLWGPDKFFLSLGNPMPPKASKDIENSFERFDMDLLGAHYRMLLEDILQDKRLKMARVLPQVHVLIWGNQKGV